MPKQSKRSQNASLANSIKIASNRYVLAETIKGAFGVLQSLVSHPAGLVALGSVGVFGWLKIADTIRTDPLSLQEARTRGYEPYAGTKRELKLFDDIKKWFENRQETLPTPRPGQGSAR